MLGYGSSLCLDARWYDMPSHCNEIIQVAENSALAPRMQGLSLAQTPALQCAALHDLEHSEGDTDSQHVRAAIRGCCFHNDVFNILLCIPWSYHLAPTGCPTWERPTLALSSRPRDPYRIISLHRTSRSETQPLSFCCNRLAAICGYVFSVPLHHAICQTECRQDHGIVSKGEHSYSAICFSLSMGCMHVKGMVLNIPLLITALGSRATHPVHTEVVHWLEALTAANPADADLRAHATCVMRVSRARRRAVTGAL